MVEDTENEAKVDLKGVIKDLADQIKILTKIVEEATKRTKTNTSANADWHKYQALMRIEQEKEHGRQVRLNKEYGRSAASLQMFTGLLTKGVSAGFIFNKLAGSIGGVSKELDKFKQETEQLTKLEEKYKKMKLDLSKPENIAEHDILAAQKARTDEAKERVDEKKGGSGKLAEGISSMKAFADKHKTGILIGAGSIGILLTVLKKAFDVSPMFQAIKKLLHFGFMLILRPIGDFFGFIMRPIMVLMLRKFIIPWYKDVYPVMKRLGTWLGNWVAGAMNAAGDPATIAAVAIGSAGVIAAIYVVAKKITIGLSTSVVKGVLANLGIKIPKVPKVPAVPSSPVPKVPKLPPPPKVPIIKLPPVVANVLAKVATLPTVIKAGVANAVTKSVGTLKAIVTPITKALTSPIVAQAASKMVTVAKIAAKPLSRLIPIAGAVLLAVDAVGSTLKHFAPEQYEGIRQGAFGIGAALGDTEGTYTEGLLDFLGFGTKSTAEQVAGAVGYGMDKLGISTGSSGTGGGKGFARGNAGNGVVINIDHVSNEADIQRLGNVMQERLQESNHRTLKT